MVYKQKRCPKDHSSEWQKIRRLQGDKSDIKYKWKTGYMQEEPEQVVWCMQVVQVSEEKGRRIGIRHLFGAWW